MSDPALSTDTLAGRLAREFIAVRERTDRILGLLTPEAYTEQGLWERYPPVFFDGHIDAFAQTRIFRDGFGEESFRPDLDDLFFRGMAPLTPEESRRCLPNRWPSREEITAYKERVRRRLFDMLSTTVLEREAHPFLKNGHALIASLEHECMHQESILFVIHRLPDDRKRRPAKYATPVDSAPPIPRTVEIPDGTALLGAREGEFPFAWDNEYPSHEVRVPAFSIDVFNVTNARFLEFVEEGGYRRREFWTDRTWPWREEKGLDAPQGWTRDGRDWIYRGFYETFPLPRAWPAYVTHAEAEAFARYSHAALPTEAQWHRAALGDSPAQLYPWGDEPPSPERGNFDFIAESAEPVGARPAGASPFGVQDLVGNGWEWTSTLLYPFPGFSPMPLYPQYTVDFFDGEHYVLKGASCFTAACLLRRSFRTWYRWDYPHAYASFRMIK